MTKPSVLVNQGVNQTSSAAPAHSAFCSPPPAAPPTSTSAAAVEIERDEPENRRDLRDGRPFHVHAGVEDHDDGVADPERETLPCIRIRNRESDDEERRPSHRAAESRNRSRSVAIAFVSQA